MKHNKPMPTECPLCGGNLIAGSHNTIPVGPPVPNICKCDKCGTFFGGEKK